LNLRPLGPEPSALAKLSHTPGKTRPVARPLDCGHGQSHRVRSEAGILTRCAFWSTLFVSSSGRPPSAVPSAKCSCGHVYRDGPATARSGPKKSRPPLFARLPRRIVPPHNRSRWPSPPRPRRVAPVFFDISLANASSRGLNLGVARRAQRIDPCGFCRADRDTRTDNRPCVVRSRRRRSRSGPPVDRSRPLTGSRESCPIGMVRISAKFVRTPRIAPSRPT
jgi:hypothetical protein